MRILFVNSGLRGVPEGYASSINSTLAFDLQCEIKEIWPQRFTFKDIIIYNPDFIFVLHGNLTPIKLIKEARKLGIKTILWIIEDPYEIDVHIPDWLDNYNYIFTNEIRAVDYYKSDNVYYLPWCTNPRIYRPFSVDKRYQSDLCFIGMGFKNRVRLLNQIADYLIRLKVILIGDFTSWGASLKTCLQSFIYPQVLEPVEVARYYNGASINLNIHRDPLDKELNVNTAGVQADSLNNRTYDIAGTGGFQLIDNQRQELTKQFQPDREIVTFNNPDVLAKKIEYYLARPTLRRDIASNAYFRTIYEHTFRHRLSYIFKIITEGEKDGLHHYSCL